VSRSLAWSEWSELMSLISSSVVSLHQVDDTMNLKLDGPIAVTHSPSSCL